MADSKNLIVDSVEGLQVALARTRRAQVAYASYTQEQVDAIFKAAASAAAKARIPLAQIAVAETGMGLMEDKVIKNLYAAEYVYNEYKDVQTVGVVEEDAGRGFRRIVEPIGVIAAVIPTTNPTSTAIFKALLALKTRNGIVFSPHPRAKGCTVAAARIVRDAAVAAGAPEDIICWVDVPSLEMTNLAMKEADIILATGGPAMVKSAYSSGKPAIGVGAGNTPAIIDDSADVLVAVNSIIHSKTFDNGVICASEQAVIALAGVYEAVKAEFIARGCHVLSAAETDLVRQTMIINGALNAKIVGQSAAKIAALAGFEVPESTKILIGEVESVELSEAFAHEKLSPVLALYKAKTFEAALDKAARLVEDGGLGHTSSIYINPSRAERLDAFAARMKTCRILVNTPASHGAIGGLYNYYLSPSLTLGCGSWGGNSVSENVGIKHLLNTKIVAVRRDNMLWFRSPSRLFINRGCLQTALEQLKREFGCRRVFVVTDNFLFANGYSACVTEALHAMGAAVDVFFDVEPDPTLACVRAGAAQMAAFRPDCVLALGGGSPMDAAKIMWALYEHPDLSFDELAMRFMDINKRISAMPKMGEKAIFVAVPTSAGTGSEVTPFAVITDETSGIKYPLADYQLMPTAAIVDATLMDDAPKGLTAASGFDVATHALEAFASVMATHMTDGLALQALKMVFEALPRAYELGSADPRAREVMGEAATMAGMAFANAFLGICHSMAHKLGAFFHLPHGIANALLLNEVIRFNATDVPLKMGSFPQYEYPRAKARYARVADELGLKGKTEDAKVAALLVALDELKARIGIRESIAAYGIDESEFLAKLDEMCLLAFDDQCTGANPRYPLVAELRQMYLNAFYGKGDAK